MIMIIIIFEPLLKREQLSSAQAKVFELFRYSI